MMSSRPSEPQRTVCPPRQQGNGRGSVGGIAKRLERRPQGGIQSLLDSVEARRRNGNGSRNGSSVDVMSIDTKYLDRILDPVAECLTPQVARRLADLRPDSRTQDRLDALAAKANEGELSPEEDAEYKQSVDAIDLLAILQAKARAYLRQHPSS